MCSSCPSLVTVLDALSCPLMSSSNMIRWQKIKGNWKREKKKKKGIFSADTSVPRQFSKKPDKQWRDCKREGGNTRVGGRVREEDRTTATLHRQFWRVLFSSSQGYCDGKGNLGSLHPFLPQALVSILNVLHRRSEAYLQDKEFPVRGGVTEKTESICAVRSIQMGMTHDQMLTSLKTKLISCTYCEKERKKVWF